MRDRLAGDELLLWTVETFTMFYEKTWAQRFMIPIIGLGPLLLSIFTFIYDNYSDIELAIEYYIQALKSPPPASINVTSNYTVCTKAACDDLMSPTTSNLLYSDGTCTDIVRTPSEYRTAFITNIICMCSAMLVSYVMCVRELVVTISNYIKRHRWEKRMSKGALTLFKCIVFGLCAFPTGLFLAPFFILYIGIVPKLRWYNHSIKNFYTFGIIFV